MSDEGKIAFVRKLKEDLCCKDWRAFKAGLKAFCGGKKKGTGGTPPVHAAHANRQQQQQQQVLLQVQFGSGAKENYSVHYSCVVDSQAIALFVAHA